MKTLSLSENDVTKVIREYLAVHQHATNEELVAAVRLEELCRIGDTLRRLTMSGELRVYFQDGQLYFSANQV